MIWEHQDYRDFLKSRFDELKRARASTSLTTVSRKIGVSKTFVRFVMLKKRHFTLDAVDALSRAFQMTVLERQAFVFLMIRNQIKAPELTAYLDLILDQLRSRAQTALADNRWERPVTANSLPALTPLFDALARLEGYRPDVAWIRNTLNLDLGSDEIRDALQSAKARASHGTTSPVPLPFGELETLESQKATLSQLWAAIERPSYARPCEHFSQPLPLDEESLPKLTQAWTEFQSRLREISQSSRAPNKIVVVSAGYFCAADTSEARSPS